MFEPAGSERFVRERKCPMDTKTSAGCYGARVGMEVR
jgi:hypothetical protein